MRKTGDAGLFRNPDSDPMPEPPMPELPMPERPMNDSGGSITVHVHGAIAEIPAAAWDACAGDVNPSVSYAFLSALEDSGSTTARTGWEPQHLSLAGPDGTILGVVPLYAKTHSYGEYVFDYGWADAYERAGGRYYPKLLSAVPFTPVPGPRLLLRPARRRETRAHLIAAMVELAPTAGTSPRCTSPFPSAAEAALERGRVSPAHRPAIPLDQRRLPRFRRLSCGAQFAQAQGGQKGAPRSLGRRARDRGADRRRSDTRALGRVLPFLSATSDRKWGQAYLNRKFFALIGERMPEKVVW